MRAPAPTQPMRPATAVEDVPRDRAAVEVRPATAEDVPGACAAVAQLLTELGATPPPAARMEEAARALIDRAGIHDPGAGSAGALLVAEADAQIVGVLGASWQIAIHAPGPYALIQDLWVAPPWRARAVGTRLLAALVALAREHRIDRLEVGLPRDNFPGLPATEAFYAHNGFAPVGQRMRRALP